MSYQTWHTYGYGVCTEKIQIRSVEDLEKLISLAPKYEMEIKEWLAGNEIEKPTIDDYLEYDEDEYCKLASILKAVIFEVEEVEFTACNNFDGENYLIYEPSYPWHMSKADSSMTEERIEEMLRKYISIVTNQMPEMDYQSVGNGG